MRYLNSISAAAVLAIASGSAFADGFVRMSDAGGNFNGTNPTGGAFQTNIESGAGNDAGRRGGPGVTPGMAAFLTFCVERNENVTLGGATGNNSASNRYFAKIADGAVNGGYSGGSPDQLSAATRLLYHNFRRGLSVVGSVNPVVVDGINNFSRGGQNLQAAGVVSALQFAIWYLEGEFNPESSPGVRDQTWNNAPATVNSFPGQNVGSGQLNTQYKTLAAEMVNWARANASSTSTYGVRVMQLWGWQSNSALRQNNNRDNPNNYTVNAQDQLTLIPLPTTGALAGVGLLVMGARFRRRSA
jgi:hypothetical protein